jgi:hypothetical protein
MWRLHRTSSAKRSLRSAVATRRALSSTSSGSVPNLPSAPLSLTASQIRSSWRSFFGARNHTLVDISSLLPHNDPSLLFVNAGMVQFKEVFMGLEKRPYSRAATVQVFSAFAYVSRAVSCSSIFSLLWQKRCVRAGGKHNDLDSVGVTARHHTLFEMLGNFSWEGQSYFKEQAIVYAWDYLTRELQLPTQRLSVSVFKTDDESAELWKKVTGWKDGESTGLTPLLAAHRVCSLLHCNSCHVIHNDRQNRAQRQSRQLLVDGRRPWAVWAVHRSVLGSGSRGGWGPVARNLESGVYAV